MAIDIKPMKIRAWIENGHTQVKAIIFHPMETGLRKDKNTGKLLPAKYIQTIVAKHNEKIVLDCKWASSISMNPFMSFSFNGGKSGDKIEIAWVDNEGQTGKGEVNIT